jgi:hypothetical protein
VILQEDRHALVHPEEFEDAVRASQTQVGHVQLRVGLEDQFTVDVSVTPLHEEF